MFQTSIQTCFMYSVDHNDIFDRAWQFNPHLKHHIEVSLLTMVILTIRLLCNNDTLSKKVNQNQKGRLIKHSGPRITMPP